MPVAAPRLVATAPPLAGGLHSLELAPVVLMAGALLLLACAVLVKGPVALALTGVAYLLVLVAVPELRPAMLRLHLVRGAAIVLVVAGPWFLYMWWRFGDTFVQGYVLNENIWLFTRPLYGSQPSRLFYVRAAPLERRSLAHSSS